MKKILITGGAGFIGAHLVRACREGGFEVHAPSRTELNLADAQSIDEYVEKVKPSIVFHLATSSLMSGKTEGLETLLKINVEGTIRLMDAAERCGVGAFINMGSFVEYGPKQHPLREDMLCEPVEMYALSKLAATLYGQGLAKRSGFPCVTFRLFTPYGPGIQPGRLIRTMIEKILTGDSVPLSDADVARDFIYVHDIIPLLLEAMDKAAQNKGKIFNLGSGNRTTIAELVSVAEEETGKKAEAHWGAFPTQSYDSKLWQADMTKTFGAFEWRPRTALAEGIRSTAAWLGSNA